MGIKDLARKALPPQLHPAALARRRIVRHTGGKVVAGPFAGMTYLTHPDDFIEDAMLVGSYEKELHPVIERWLAEPPSVLIDVGAAQGYYSIGLARRCPKSRNIAFEMHAPRVEQLERTAKANGVTVEQWGECSKPKLLEALALGDAILICDVEGYEMYLLDEEVAAAMKNCRAIIETHDDLVPGVTDALRQRLSPSHALETVSLVPRTASDLPFKVVDRWTLGAIDEGREAEDQTWLIATPK